MGAHPLYLHEEILLLALHDDKGTIPMGTMFSCALGGAILAELILQERVGTERRKRSTLVTLRNTAQTGEPVLDEAFERIRTAKRRAAAATWVERFANRSPWKRVADRLCQRGILRRDEGRFLLIFSRATFPTANPEPERELVERMRRAIFEDGAVDARTAILVSLAKSADLLRLVFDRKSLKLRKRRIEELTKLDAAAGATKEAIEAAYAAMVAVNAAMVAVVAASSASSG